MSIISNAEKLESQDSPDDNSTEKQPRKLSNLLVRFFTGMVLLPIILLLIFLGGWFLTIALGILMLFGILEFYFMEKRRGAQNNALLGVISAIMVMLAFQLREPLLWQGAVVATIMITFIVEFGRRDFKESVQRIATTIGGIFYIAFPMAFLVAIRAGDSGLHWFFAYIYCTWGTDTFAYLIGNMFGKTKLAPVLSPKKTVEGAIGGIIAGSLLPLGVLYQGGIPITIGAFFLFMLASFAGTAGDLFESRVKRFFGIKDSHIPGFNIFPGHGGVLDRIDSTLFVAPVIYIYLVWAGYITLLM